MAESKNEFAKNKTLVLAVAAGLERDEVWLNRLGIPESEAF